jgi:Ca2+:H+ antiporter
VVWELAGYLVWPFGKYVEEWSEEEEEDGSSDQQQQSDDHRAHSVHPAERFGSGRFDFSSSAVGPHSSRWVTVSEIDEDEVASIDRLTIRGGTENDDERTALVPVDRERPAANYGGTSPSGPTVPTSNSNSQDRRHASDSTIKSDLLGLFMNNKRADGGAGQPKRQIRVRALGRLSFWVAYYLIIAPLMLTACLLCWFFVVTIPMAKLLWVLVQHVGTEPLALHFRSPPTYIDLHQVEIGLVQQEQQEQLQQQMDGQPAGEARPEADPHPHHHYHHHHRVSSRLPPQLKPGQPAPKHSKKSLSESRAKGRLVSGKAKVLLCTYKALGLQYYKYTVDGVNIMFIILIPFVMFVILDFFFLAPLKLGGVLGLLSSQMVLFVMALLSVIPLSYFIGMAVASISAQSSIGMGAVINATFGSVIEIILYGIALAEGKGELVEGSIIGSLLAGVLLLPGTSMIGGSFKRKEQRFNARSAGVTSTMLIMAIIGTLTPTLFYEIYGTVRRLSLSLSLS